MLFDLADRDRLFSFPTSVSTDGRLVALLLSPFDFDYDLYVEQRLVITSVDGGGPLVDMPLSSVYTDGFLAQLDRGESGPVEKAYAGRAEQANRILFPHHMRPLKEDCALDLELADWRLTVHRSGNSQSCYDARVDAWAPKLSEPRCVSVNRPLVELAGCDPPTGLVVIRVGMNGGHVGCQAPATAAHAFRLPKACLAGDAAAPALNAR